MKLYLSNSRKSPDHKPGSYEETQSPWHLLERATQWEREAVPEESNLTSLSMTWRQWRTLMGFAFDSKLGLY